MNFFHLRETSCVKKIFICILALLNSSLVLALPKHFVYLADIAPDILQDMRYAGSHNFVGRPIYGYEAKRCILTRHTALALAKVQQQLEPLQLSLKVYDCYRPTSAVNDFMIWSQERKDQRMKREFYPFINKRDLFKLEYIAARSGHSRGSTIDLTIVQLPVKKEGSYTQLQPCNANYAHRFRDNSIDMGSGFDCFDVISHYDAGTIPKKAYAHRKFLRAIMMKNGFIPYQREWWHFTLKQEDYPWTYFNFPVR